MGNLEVTSFIHSSKELRNKSEIERGMTNGICNSIGSSNGGTVYQLCTGGSAPLIINLLQGQLAYPASRRSTCYRIGSLCTESVLLPYQKRITVRMLFGYQTRCSAKRHVLRLDLNAE